MKKKTLLGLVTVAGLSLTLAACSNNKPTETKNPDEKKEHHFSPTVKNQGEAIKGQTLEIAQVSSNDFTGIFSRTFATNTLDSSFFEPADEPLFTYDENLRVRDGAAAVKFDEAKKQVRLTLRDNLKWNDGEDVTADDIVFTYEVIADKDYDGVRYNNNIRNIVGIEDYHDGKADTISGIEKINDKEVVITYKEFTPSMLQGGGGVWSSVMPKHVFENIPVKDMEASDAVRKNPVSFGPYYVSKIVPGESVEFLPNEHYYGEQPKLDKIVMKKVPTASATASIAAKEYDIYSGMPTAEYTSWQNSEGYDILGQQQTSYNYIGFKMGHWDAKEAKNIYNPEAKMANKELRQAIGYAIDNETIANQLYNGLQVRANSLIVPAFTNLHDDSFEGYTYSPEKANELLDKAGFKDTNDDGIREDPEGKPFKINFAFRDGGDTAQALAEYYIQQWSEVGLDVELTSGRLIEVNSFYEMLEKDDPKIDMYQAGWSTGYDPNPTGLYSETGAFNYTRFVSEKNEQLLNALSSTEALDPAKAKQLYGEWQAYAFDEAYVIPTTYVYEVVPVAERVTGYDISRDLDYYVYADLGVTAEKR